MIANVRTRTVLAVVAVTALLGTACGGDDEATPVEAAIDETTTTAPDDDAASPTDDSTDEARLFADCDQVGEAVERHLDEEVLEVRQLAGGGFTVAGVVFSTESCDVETDDASYGFADYIDADAGDGTTTRALAVWEALEDEAEAAEAARADADDRAEQLIGQIESGGATVDGARHDDEEEILLLVGGTTYGVSFSGFGTDPTPADLEGLTEVAIAVALAAPTGIDALCSAVVDAIDETLGGSDGEPRTGGGGGQAGGIEFETRSCSIDLQDSELGVRASISNEQHWEATTIAAERTGPDGFTVRAEPIDGLGDDAFISGDDLVVRIDDRVVRVGGYTRDDNSLTPIPPADLVDLATAVLDDLREST